MIGAESIKRLMRSRKFWVAVVVVGVAAFAAYSYFTGTDDVSIIDPDNPTRSYVGVFVLVALDAVVPIFPGETTLNAAATAAAQGTLDLAIVMVMGALGAIVGDSALFWIARRNSGRVEPQLQRARANDRVRQALTVMDASARLLIVGGRYVPGMRFVVNATMGLSNMPYRRFLPWSVLGGVLWSVYTAGLAYIVGTALVGFPLASVVISGAVTAAAVTVIFVVLRRRNRAATGAADTGAPEDDALDGSGAGR